MLYTYYCTGKLFCANAQNRQLAFSWEAIGRQGVGILAGRLFWLMFGPFAGGVSMAGSMLSNGFTGQDRMVPLEAADCGY